MKNNKGITIASLLIYVVAMGIIISIIALVLSFYNKNVLVMNDIGDINLELNKFETKMIQETKTSGNQITEVTDTTIKFSSGNTYIFTDNRIYQNEIQLSQSVKEFTANLETDGNKQLLKIYILLGKNQAEVVKNLSYTIELNNGTNTTSPTYVGTVYPVDSNGLATQNVTITTSTPNVQIVIPKGMAPVILKGSNTTTSEPGQDGSVKEIMPPDQWKNITAEQINKGIVIVDHAITYDNGQSTGTVPDFNEYVWVSIPDSSKFTRTAWITPYTWDGKGNWINGTNTTLRHPLAEVATTYYFWEDTTSNEYINMVSSINTNKGFYIGRYEASNNGSNIAQSKRKQNQWTDISPENSKIACKSNISSANMHLIYAIEWDTMLNWLKNNATISSATSGQTKTMELTDIQTNSSSWGNYNNSTGNAANNSGSKQATGFSEYWKANNIYDLAGNVREWTQEEYSTNIDYPGRGGYYASDGNDGSAANRGTSDEYLTYSTNGFRMSFYL